MLEPDVGLFFLTDTACLHTAFYPVLHLASEGN